MVEGPVKIVMSYKEVNRHHIWMRPFLHREGYELLYYGAKGWTPLCCSKHCHIHHNCNNQPPKEEIVPPYISDNCDCTIDEILSEDNNK